MRTHCNELIPYIPSKDYDKIAYEFLEKFYPEALKSPMPVPIVNIAKDKIGLNIQNVCLSEELNIYGMTVFTDGFVDVYDTKENLYDKRFFKAKTILIDPEVVKQTNIGCRNNTIAHECVHWYKHRYYYKMQQQKFLKYAKYCKCYIDQMPDDSTQNNIIEAQANGIAPRILMPRNTFIEVAENYRVSNCQDNSNIITTLANFFCVSKQSVKIRLKECCIQ
ncbi:MAG: ImmA/IrrE family metallo-endopeptidase [bacterium]|nr:ImmA/IrrE family metallo-endopeptidase [bacterium]